MGIRSFHRHHIDPGTEIEGMVLLYRCHLLLLLTLDIAYLRVDLLPHSSAGKYRKGQTRLALGEGIHKENIDVNPRLSQSLCDSLWVRAPQPQHILERPETDPVISKVLVGFDRPDGISSVILKTVKGHVPSLG